MSLQQLNLFGEPEPVIQETKKPEKKPVEQPEIKEEVTEEKSIILSQEINLKEEIFFEEIVVEETIEVEEEIFNLKDTDPGSFFKKPADKGYGHPLNYNEHKLQKKRGRKSYASMDAEADFISLPNDEILNKKLYHSITDVSQWFNLNPSVLRYWENEFPALKPRKNGKGDRMYKVADIKIIQLIYYLLRTKKLSIEGAKSYLRNNKNQADNNLQLLESLNRFKSFLLLLKSNL